MSQQPCLLRRLLLDPLCLLERTGYGGVLPCTAIIVRLPSPQQPDKRHERQQHEKDSEGHIEQLRKRYGKRHWTLVLNKPSASVR
jgi:hypothetical protein